VSGSAVRGAVESSSPLQRLSSSDLVRLGVTDVGDALKHMSGVTVKDYGGIGGLKTVSIRGLGAQHTAVFYDGVAVGDCQSGQVDLGRYSTENLSGVELSIGQSDDIYKSARVLAAAGVVSMESLGAVGDSRLGSWQVGVRAASFDTYKGNVKYSKNSNGNPMTATPQSDTEYMGTIDTTATTPPTSYSAYTWVKIKGNTGATGTAGKDGENGLTPYLHIMYSQDGLTFTPQMLNEDGSVLYALGKKPSAWIGQYTDYNEKDSTNFNDYEWYKFTEDIDEELTDIQQHISDNTNAITTLKTEMEQTNQSFSFSIEELQTQAQNNLQRIDGIDNKIDNGVEVVKNKLVVININGISVSTNSSAISTLLSNDRFSIKSKSGELFFVGYDYEQQKTISRIDNLTVTTYFTRGYHREEGFEIDGEYRTGDFYVGV
jgi:hypothetical protein